MDPEFDTVHFTLAGHSFEWNGTTRTLKLVDGSEAQMATLLEVIQGVILDCSGTHVPAVVAVDRAAKRLAQPISDLRVVGNNGGNIPSDAQA
ncbi:hypothetical protein [Luteolibacter soli]|uniref:Uncharacterized protein n=1 Tax=Luteolibacter soli TaxID=3135280 RepID=A0ABU9AZR0_9BACT